MSREAAERYPIVSHGRIQAALIHARRLLFPNKCRCCNNLHAHGHEQSLTTYTGDHLTLEPTFEDLAKARDRGCPFCSALLTLAAAFELNIGTHHWVELTLTRGEPAHIRMPRGRLNSIRIYSPKDTLASQLQTLCRARDIPESSGSDASFAFIERQLAKCVHVHRACVQKEPSTLPLRVLDIQDGPGHIKLCDNESGRGRYAALSYCWGQQSHTQGLMLRKSSISQMRQRISWESLPSAFQDAILVAFKLQIRYLWIDSLCILQDNKEDWEQEASKMADYYQNAHVTIAANFISDPTRSFLALKDARWIPKRFEVVSKQLPHSFLHARRVCASLMDPAPGTGLTPLAGRGWAWQENVLSCRVLHYLESEIIWECRTSTCCEDETLAREPYNYCQQMKDLRLSPYLMWQSWVGTFSERSLTFESDRLPAISGAAKLVSTSTGSQYLAGLWRDNIIEDLLWKYISPMNEFLERDRLQSRTGIPSWSWASLSWPVYYPTVMERPTLINFKPAVSVLDAHCSVPGLNPFGEVTAGHLRIKGSLISGNLTRSSISTPYTITLNGDIKVKALQGQPSTVSADFALEECKSDLFAGRSVRRTLYLDSRLSSPAPIHCLYLGEGINDDKAGKPQYLALLLGRSTTVKEAFTRIGLCQLSHNDCLKIASTEIVLLV